MSKENLPNVCHKRKLVFVHNPKAAGTSFRTYLGFDGRTSHVFPTHLIPLNIWETYQVVVVVRDPIDRFISSYKYHTNEKYNGAILRQFPSLHSFEIREYFYKVATKNLHILSPQYLYTIHAESHKRADIIIKYEELSDFDFKSIFNIDKMFPFLNKTEPSQISIDAELLENMKYYYKIDYEHFEFHD